MKITYLKKSLGFLAKAFFPEHCLVCHREGSWLCQNHYYFPSNSTFYVHKHLNKVQARTSYQHRNARLLMENLKFKGIKSLSKLCATEMTPLINQIDKNAILIPIPLHWQRKMQRGFNQSELIVREIKKQNPEIKIDITSFKRKSKTQQQAKLTKEKRLNNMKNAFFWVNKKDNIPQSVILVDDILTTGATLESAAQSLKREGVKEVHAIVFAHG